MSIEKYKRSKIFIKYTLILGWLSIWFSISFNPENLSYNFLYLDFFQQINYLRGISQLIFFPVVLLIFIIFTYKDTILKKSNLIHNLLIIFFFIQLIGLLFNENPNINLYYSITSINVVLTTYIFKNYFSESDTNNLLKISILILLSVFVYFSFDYIKQSIILHKDLYTVWGKLGTNSLNSFYETPKPTGLSRTALIILIFFSIISFHHKNNFFISLITVLTISMIILLSSRLILLILLIFIIFYLFYFQILKRKKIINFIKNFILYPFILIFFINIFLNFDSNIKTDNYNLKVNIFENKIKRDFPQFKEYRNINHDFIHGNRTGKKNKFEYFTSGRSKDWNEILKKNNKIIIGNGVMGDRFLINQTASNLLIYSYASSGLIGTILIFFICLKIFINTINLISKRKEILETPYILVSCLIITTLLIRSTLETSFGVFGIDLLMFCSSLAIITKESKG
tara:strand:+ start:132 stop:1502 length:1371 start_codon:yes stop_codon:yes gene_type:complete